MSPHDAHEFLGGEYDDREQAWEEYREAEIIRAFTDLSRNAQARSLSEQLRIFVTPPTSDLEPEILPFLDPDPEE